MFDDYVKLIIESLIDDFEVIVPFVDVGFAERIGVLFWEIGDEGMFSLWVFGLDLTEIFV